MIRSLLRPWARASTWWDLVLVVSGAWTGVLTTTVVLTAAIVVLTTALVVPFAAAVLWVTFIAGHALAEMERSRYRALAGVDLPEDAPLPDSTTRWQRFLLRLRSPSRWRELLYLGLRLPVSWVLATLAAGAWAWGLGLAALPAYAHRIPERPTPLLGIELASGATPWIGGLIGLALVVVVAPWATVGLARADVAFGRALLTRSAEHRMREQVVQLESRRVAALDSAEAERRRIERDLHDGAQQRLIAAAMDLGVARDRLVTDPEAGRELVASAHEEVKSALVELRDLVRGIHPVILEDRGLDAALSAVVARSPVPVGLSVEVDRRPSATVESTAYFVVSEALANVARHAEATSARVDIRREGDVLTVVVTDDGHGGADSSRGTGLSGLVDRVDAAGGTFHVLSPPGGPTRLEARLPCAS